MSTSSARSSVKELNLCYSAEIFTPVANVRQEKPTSGKHARSSPLSVMFRQQARGLDQSRKASRQISPSGSHIAPNFRCVAHRSRNQRLSLYRALIPLGAVCAAPVLGAAFFLR